MQVFYILKCTCKWWRKCLGTTESWKDLVEFKPCVSCHGPRKFKCPKCGKIVKAVRAEYPDPPEEPVTVQLPSFTLSVPDTPPIQIEVPPAPVTPEMAVPFISMTEAAIPSILDGESWKIASAEAISEPVLTDEEYFRKSLFTPMVFPPAFDSLVSPPIPPTQIETQAPESHFIGDVIVPGFVDSLPALNETSAHELGLLIAKRLLEAQKVKDAPIQEKK